MELDLGGAVFATHLEVEELNGDGKSHGEIDVALGDFLVEALSDQHASDE